MRTNIDLDEDLLRKARKYSSAKTKRALVEEALRKFIESNEYQRRLAAWNKSVDEIVKMTSNLRMDESAADIIRADRNRDD
jgi:Arc/MetJ family transcription regulator